MKSQAHAVCLALFYLQKALYCGKIWRIEYETEGVEDYSSVKRETGANPVRTRHRNYGVYANMPLVTREGGINEDVSVGRPAFRCTRGFPRATRNWLYEKERVLLPVFSHVLFCMPLSFR